MLNRCGCGRYTDYGVTCVSCTWLKEKDEAELDFEIDDLIDDEEKSTPFPDAASDPEGSSSDPHPEDHQPQ
jgi:hypothetical protein